MTVVFDGPIQGIFLNAKNNYHISFLWQFKNNIPVPHSYMFSDARSQCLLPSALGRYSTGKK
jgi:hypothetical protein